MRVPKTIKLFIGGELPRTESGRSFPVPFFGTDKIYANLCLASRKDFRNAVTAAKDALKGWESKTAYNRSQILYRMGEMAEGKRHEIVEILESTLGLSESVANKSVDEAIEAFVYYSGWCDKFSQVIGAVNPVAGPHHNFTGAEPVGVVTLIGSEKFNLKDLVMMISAVIASGNTLVALMPQEGAATIAPLSEIFMTSDLPKGVINLLSGDTQELYKVVGSHMEAQAVCYLGTDANVLKELKTSAVDSMKRVVSLPKEKWGLEPVLSFVEYKTVWHPIGY